MKLPLIITILITTSYPQIAHWQPVRSDSNIYDIAASRSNILFICEDEGIYKSSDYGLTWENAFPVYSIKMIEIDTATERIYAVSSNGSIYKSNDGINWDTCLVTGLFSSLHITKNGNVFAGTLNGVIYRSTDYGENWDSISISNNPITFIISTLDGILLASSEEILFKSTNYGQTWSSNNPLNYYIKSLCINRLDILYILANNQLFISSDFGVTWSLICNLNFGKLRIDESGTLYFISDCCIWKEIHRSTNNGSSFENTGAINGPIFEVINMHDTVYLASIGLFKYKYESTPINEQDFLPLHQGNHWQYLNRIAGPAVTVDFYLLNSKILKDTVVNSRTYYQVNNRWLAYDENIIYMLAGGSEKMHMDFNMSSGSYFRQWSTIPYSGFMINSAMVIDGNISIFGKTELYKGYNSYDDYYIYQESKYLNNCGLINYSFGHLFGPTYYYSLNLIEAIIYDSLNVPHHYSYYFKPIISLNPILSINNPNFILQLTVQHEHSRINVTGTDLNYIESVKMISFYAKEDTIFNADINGIYNTGISYSFILTLDTNKMKNGYSFFYKISAKDKGIIPGYTTSPDTGYYKCIWNPVITLDDFSTDYSYLLSQNFPNPFNPSTNIFYSLHERSHVNIKVYNLLGEQVNELINEEQERGGHTINFDGKNLPSGIYYYQLKAGPFLSIKKMILLR